MGKLVCVEFWRYSLKFHRNTYYPYIEISLFWEFKSSQIYDLRIVYLMSSASACLMILYFLILDLRQRFALQWRHMSAMDSQIADNLTVFFLKLVEPNNKRKHQSNTFISHCERSPAKTGGFSSQRASIAEIISMPFRLHGYLCLDMSSL